MTENNTVLIAVDPSQVIDGQTDSQAFFNSMTSLTAEGYISAKQALEDKFNNASTLEKLGWYADLTKTLASALSKGTLLGAPATAAKLSAAIGVLGEAVQSGEVKSSDITAITGAIVGTIAAVGTMAVVGTGIVIGGVGGLPFWGSALALGGVITAAGWFLDEFGDELSEAVGGLYDTLKGELKAAGDYIEDLWHKTSNDFGDFIDGLSQKYSNALTTVSPLVLDLDGNGVTSISISDSIHFDHDGNGLAELTGWVSKGDALLVWDKNSDGVINDGNELFGSQSLSPSNSKAANGFEALKALDSNQDGVFDANDQNFAQIKLWKDANSDGIAQSEELLTLNSAGVQSISLKYQEAATIDAFGNQHLQTGSFTRADGTIAAIDDVWFTTNPANTLDNTNISINDTVAEMPEVRGAGSVHSLQHSMALDKTGHLFDLVSEYMSTPSNLPLTDLADNILFAWTGTSHLAPESRGGYLDARKIAVVEAFMGKEFIQGAGEYEGTANPSLHSSEILNDIYDKLRDYVAANLDLHKPAYLSIVSLIHLDFSGNTTTYDVTGALMALETAYEASPVDGHKLINAIYSTLISAGGDGLAIVQALRDHGSSTGKDYDFEIANAGRWILGTTGNDTLNYSAGDHVFDGAGGSDWINSTGGDNVFIYNQGYGYLEINNTYSNQDQATLRLGQGITAASLSVTTTESGNSLILRDGVDGDEIVLDYSLLNQNSGIKTVVFSDGTLLSKQQLIGLKDDQLNNKIAMGTTGSDTLTGTAIAQNFDGKGGQDVIVGGGGNDTFLYKPGYGYLEINNAYLDGENPILKLGQGITAESLQVSTTASGNSMILTDGIDGDMVVLDYSLIYQNYGVKSVQLSDGSSLSMTDLSSLKDAWINLTKYTGTDQPDTITGTSESQIFDGKGGSDVINGSGGSDTFIYHKGYGYLEINNPYSDADRPILKFDASITASSISVSTTQSGNSLILHDGVEGDIVVMDYSQIWSNYGVTSVEFSNGTSISKAQLVAMKDLHTGHASDDILNGSANIEAFDGLGGHDVIHSGGGADLFRFNEGYGSLEIDAVYSAEDASMLIFGSGINASSLSAVESSSGHDLLIYTGHEGDYIQLDEMLSNSGHGVKFAQFADGSVMTASELIELAHAPVIEPVGVFSHG